jgi:CDP-glucose 4,6-dehydratase
VEILTNAWRQSFFGSGSNVRVATARAGNVIGPGDWAEDRILPDFMRAVIEDRPLHIRNPGAVRPWQHVLEPLSGYLQLGMLLSRPDGKRFAEAWNFGPRSGAVYTVKSLVESMAERYGKGSWEISSDDSAQKEAGLLALSIDKAMTRLGWKPVWGFDETVRRTAEGYLLLQKTAGGHEAAGDMLNGQILDYIRDAQAAGVSWTVDEALFPE